MNKFYFYDSNQHELMHDDNMASSFSKKGKKPENEGKKNWKKSVMGGYRIEITGKKSREE